MGTVRAAQLCPSCGDDLTIERLSCASCGTVVEGSFRWPRLARLSRDDQRLAELMILSSGSLKAVARALDVSYPTVRKRLDELIGRLEAEVEADARYRRELLEEVERGTRSAAEVARRLEEE